MAVALLPVGTSHIRLPFHQPGRSEGRTLSIIHAELSQFPDDSFALGVFCDGLNPHRVSDLVDSGHDCTVYGVFYHLSHKTPVDLQIVHGQVLEVGEGRQAAAEVIQSEAAAGFFHLRDEMGGLREIGNGGRLGNLGG